MPATEQISIRSRTPGEGTLLVVLHLPDDLAEEFFFQVLSMADGGGYEARARKEYKMQDGVASYVYTIFYWGDDLAAAEAHLRAVLTVRNTMPTWVPPRASPPQWVEPPTVQPPLPPPSQAPAEPARAPGRTSRLVRTPTEHGYVVRMRLPHYPDGVEALHFAPPGKKTVTVEDHRRAANKGIYFATVSNAAEGKGEPNAGDY